MSKLTAAQIKYLETHVMTYDNFPAEGISFKDLSLIYTDSLSLDIIENYIRSIFNSKYYLGKIPECVIGCDARGFIIGMMIARVLKIPFVMARKPGKLPGELLKQEYELEYGKTELQIHKHIIEQYKSAIIADDVLATGGTVLAVSKMLYSIGLEDISYVFLMEISGLNGAGRIQEYYGNSVNNQIFSILKTP